MKRQLLETVIDELQTGVLAIDAGSRILYANPFFAKTFSAKAKPEGEKLSDIIKERSVVEVMEGMLASEESVPREIEIQGKEDRLFEIRLVPHRQAAGRNNQNVLIGFFHDVTEEKRVEAIKRDFVANVSHELRTPLASIKGYAETLLDGALEDKKTLKNFLVIIDRHANRMTALIEDLLTLSMLESHQMPMSFEPLDIRELISNVIQSFEKQAQDKSIKLIMDINKDIPNIMADKNRLEQVIVNLVDNAIKYTNSGAVRISAKKAYAMLRIDVQDTGIGIPEKDIPRLFERFYRVDKGRSREMGGTGLGLAIVKHIIQGHNGKIRVTSQPGKGSTFSFAIPIKR